MPTTLRIEIDLSNAAFEGRDAHEDYNMQEVESVLARFFQVAPLLMPEDGQLALRDTNGNTCGSVEVTD